MECGKDYESKRIDSQFCSKKCRVYSGRGVALNPSIVAHSDESVALNPVSAVKPPDSAPVSGTKSPKIVDSGECSRQNTFLMVGVNKDINYGAWKPIGDLGAREVNRVPIPGDADYVGCCEDVDGVWRCV